MQQSSQIGQEETRDDVLRKLQDIENVILFSSNPKCHADQSMSMPTLILPTWTQLHAANHFLQLFCNMYGHTCVVHGSRVELIFTQLQKKNEKWTNCSALGCGLLDIELCYPPFLNVMKSFNSSCWPCNSLLKWACQPWYYYCHLFYFQSFCSFLFHVISFLFIFFF